MRRSWLIANGCPESTVDTPPKPEVLAAASPPAASKTADPVAASIVAAPPAQPVAPPGPTPATAAARLPAPAPTPPRSADAPPPASSLAIASAPPLPEPAPPPPPEAEPAPPLVTASAQPEPAAAKVARPPAPPPAPPPPLSVGAIAERERGELREQRLRDIIIAHGKEMRSCVDRQLKLVPDLRADGTLIIEVDANGAVPHAELLGTDLAGTPLEAFLRTVAARWRFPSNGRAYRIDAPVKVSGSARGR